MILDSNIVIYSTMIDYQNLREFLKQNENSLSISLITKVEVLGYHNISEEDRSLFTHFFGLVKNIQISSVIIEKAILLRQNRKMSLGDSLIAASAIITNQSLLTNNEEDFKNIPNLELITLKSIL